MTVSAPEVEFNLNIYQENHIVRRGLLGFYDPLLFSDLYNQALSYLNAIDTTIPSSDPTSNTTPSGINFHLFTLTIQEE